MNLKNMIHYERKQTTYCMMPMIWNGPTYRAGLAVVWSSALEQGLTLNEYGDLAKVTREF